MLVPKSLLSALLAAPLFLLGCAHDPSLPGDDAEASPQDIVIRGELSYLPRIAVPPDAVAVVEVRTGPAPSGEIVEARQWSLDGRQVPVDFTFEFDPPDTRPGSIHVFRGFLGSAGSRSWISEPVVIDTRAAVHDLGTLMLERAKPSLFVSDLICGERRARVTSSAEGLVLESAGQRFELTEVVSTSGARYQMPGDPDTEFSSKGDLASVRLVGVDWPECEVRPAPALQASGNEPGWRLDLDTETLTLIWDYGSHVLAANTPAPVLAERITSYGTRVGDRRLVIALHDRVCADDMTGMPHPKRVIISLDDRILRGCGGEPEELLSGDWVIEDVDGRGIVDSSRATLEFDGNGRIGGRGSCNRYGGDYRLSGEGLAVSGLFSTEMACVEALMRQEQRVFAILDAVSRFEVDDTGALILHAADGRTLTARR